MRRKIVALLPAVCLFLGTGIYALAEDMSIKYRIDDEGVMTITGAGVSERMRVNMQIADTDGTSFFLEQVQGDADRGFSLSVDLEKALPETDSYTLQTISQNGQSFKEDFNYCKSKDLLSIIEELNLEKQKPVPDKTNIVSILKQDNNSNVLIKVDPVVEDAFKNNLYDDCAQLLLAEESITVDNIKSVMKKVCTVCVLSLNNTADEVYSLFDQYGTNLATDKIKEFSDLDEIHKSTMFARLAALTDKYESLDEFYETVYQNIILSKLDLVNGTGGIEEIIKAYDDVLDLTVFNKTDNDKNAVLRKISKAFEDKSVKTVEEVQKMLNEMILKSTAGPGGGSITGSTGSAKGSVSTSGSKVDFSNTVEPVKIEFGDLDGFEWAKEGIEKLVALGVINGVSDNSFAPEQNVTRAEFCTMMCRLFGEKEDFEQSHFSDVSREDWYFGYVNAMYKSGVVEGVGSGSFCPAEPVTRQDAAVIIYRALVKYSSASFKTEENIPFNDNDEIAQYAALAIGNLRAEGIIHGKSDNSFEPSVNMLRAEAAQMMINTYNFIESGAGK